MKDKILEKLKDKRYKVLVIGAGISGQASCELLLNHDVAVDLYDDKSAINLPKHLAQHPNLTPHFGHAYALTHDVGVVILSPGVPPSHPLVIDAKNLGLLILSEIDLAYLFLPNVKIIGISGTNGKSSTTAMIQTIFDAAGIKAVACGNIGVPPCQLITQNKLSDVSFLVMELSSFQLETIACAKLDAAVLLNITPDHLDRYKTMENYVAAKLKMVPLLTSAAPLFLNPNLAYYFAPDRTTTLAYFGENSQIDAAGHNLENVSAAAAVARHFSVSDDAINAGIAAFKPLPHRFERLGKKLGVEYINDSKATTVPSVLEALKNVSAPVHLLLGGIAKGQSLAPLKAFAQKNVVQFYVFGHDKAQISADLGDSPKSLHEDLASSVAAARANASAGHTILLSPACASYDQFNNFGERGDAFKKIFFSL